MDDTVSGWSFLLGFVDSSPLPLYTSRFWCNPFGREGTPLCLLHQSFPITSDKTQTPFPSITNSAPHPSALNCSSSTPHSPEADQNGPQIRHTLSHSLPQLHHHPRSSRVIHPYGLRSRNPRDPRQTHQRQWPPLHHRPRRPDDLLPRRRPTWFLPTRKHHHRRWTPHGDDGTFFCPPLGHRAFAFLPLSPD